MPSCTWSTGKLHDPDIYAV